MDHLNHTELATLAAAARAQYEREAAQAGPEMNYTPKAYRLHGHWHALATLAERAKVRPVTAADLAARRERVSRQSNIRQPARMGEQYAGQLAELDALADRLVRRTCGPCNQSINLIATT